MHVRRLPHSLSLYFVCFFVCVFSFLVLLCLPPLLHLLVFSHAVSREWRYISFWPFSLPSASSRCIFPHCLFYLPLVSSPPIVCLPFERCPHRPSLFLLSLPLALPFCPLFVFYLPLLSVPLIFASFSSLFLSAFALCLLPIPSALYFSSPCH